MSAPSEIRTQKPPARRIPSRAAASALCVIAATSGSTVDPFFSAPCGNTHRTQRAATAGNTAGTWPFVAAKLDKAKNGMKCEVCFVVTSTAWKYFQKPELRKQPAKLLAKLQKHVGNLRRRIVPYFALHRNISRLLEFIPLF